MPEKQSKKSGFAVLVGRSNVGKSTLLNALVGSKIAIVTPKAQTTRHAVRGIVNDSRGQIVFVDTPGIFLGKHDPISTRLNHIVKEQFDGIEAIVYVLDPTRSVGSEEEHIQTILRKLSVPIIVAINKSDLSAKEKFSLDVVREIDVGQIATIEVSAVKRSDLNKLLDTLFSVMPEGEAYYPEQQITDMPRTQWLEELIREKIFLCLHEELPYSIKVTLTEDVERKNGQRFIAATIATTESRYKGMIIGKNGQMLKRIGTLVRKELEMISDQKVFLELNVEVDPSWQTKFR